MAYISYQQLNSLPETAFIGGTEFTMNYTVYEEDGVNLTDISGATVKVRFCPYGQTDYCVLDKAGTVTGTGTFTVVLDAVDTQDLSGKYLQQVYMESFTGVEFRPAQGVVIILPCVVV